MFEIIFAFICGTAVGLMLQRVRNSRGYKYKWKCPVCKHFSVDANSEAVINRVKAIHKHESVNLKE